MQWRGCARDVRLVGFQLGCECPALLTHLGQWGSWVADTSRTWSSERGGACQNGLPFRPSFTDRGLMMCPRVFLTSAGSVAAGVVVVVWCRRLGLHDQLTRQGVQLDRREEGGPSIEFNGGLRSTLSCFGQRLISPRRWAATGANANASAAGLGGHRRRVPPSFVEEFGIL
jgi:hypothetical protein